MSANSSSASSMDVYLFLHTCWNSTDGTINITTFAVGNVLFLLPLYILVLCLGVRRWCQQRSGATTGHSDVFTYHLTVIELMNVFGSASISCAVFADWAPMVTVGIFGQCINFVGQMFFHVFTCLDRYLAVVHPVTYMSLKTEKGVRVRNVTVFCAWLLSFSGLGILYVNGRVTFNIIIFCIMASALIVISFCSLSVLHILIRGGWAKQNADQSKLRAYYTINAILGVLMFKFGGIMLTNVLAATLTLEDHQHCGISFFMLLWCSLPSSLTQPLLFLHRAGKLACCKSDNKMGQGSDQFEEKTVEAEEGQSRADDH
ncbi:uncharacterized protein V6R79_017340 [Siganus canaliculatus]